MLNFLGCSAQGIAVASGVTTLALLERMVAAVAAFLFVAALPMSDLAGFAVLAAFVTWHLMQVRRAPARAP